MFVLLCCFEEKKRFERNERSAIYKENRAKAFDHRESANKLEDFTQAVCGMGLMIFFERLESLEYKLIYFVRQFPRPTLPIINQYFVTNVHMMQNILAPRMINILIAMRRRGHFSSLSLLNTFFRFDLFSSSVSP